MRRVVVTGLGMVTPLGSGVEPVWRRLVDGRSGLRAIQSFDTSDLPSKIAGQVPLGETAEGHFNPDDHLLRWGVLGDDALNSCCEMGSSTTANRNDHRKFEKPCNILYLNRGGAGSL